MGSSTSKSSSSLPPSAIFQKKVKIIQESLNLIYPLAHLTATYSQSPYLLAIGGSDFEGNCLTDCLRYDVDQNQWLDSTPLTMKTNGYGTIIGSSFYAIKNSTREIYQLKINQLRDDWEFITTIPGDTNPLHLCSILNRLYFLGCGLYFDSLTGTWEKLKAKCTKTAMTLNVCNNKIYIVGGESNGSITSSCEVYDPELDQYEILASLHKKRVGHTSCVWDRYIFVFGGESPWKNEQSYEIFDTKLKRWILKYCQNIRVGAIAATCGDNIYLLGGWDSPCHRLDPKSLMWTELRDLHRTRTYGHVDVVYE